MRASDIFKKKTSYVAESCDTATQPSANSPEQEAPENSFIETAPKEIGKLDMVIAFDTTGSMAAYIEDVRKQVSELIPCLFKDNEDLRLGIVAFGDYCDMKDAKTFGDAYQCQPLTDNEDDLIKFVLESRNTCGGDGDEFYELVIKKIVEETNWRKDSTRAVLLIADADPHPLGYTYENCVINNQIDWRAEARKAADMGIKFDTVTISNNTWYKALSEITDGISVPFRSSGKTARMVEAATLSRGSVKARMKFDQLYDECSTLDEEMRFTFRAYKKERDKLH